ncbi:MAG TPA: hypothetical protein VLA31_09480 [Burkholderiaceae bacterium]|nr:hypothetical protein [Burkholderiaceae bacterium]
MTRTLRPGARFRYGGFYLPDTQPGCWSARIETRDGIVQRGLVRPAPDYTGTLIEVESLDAAHAYLMATPTGSPWVTP